MCSFENLKPHWTSRKTPIKRGRPMRRVSKKRARENTKYRKLREKYLTEHPVCECCCSMKSAECHHKKGRIGKLLCEVKYFMACCIGCHHRIETQKEWAFEMGYRIDRLGHE